MSSTRHPLDFLFHPGSVAVVGASLSGGMGAGFVPALVELGFKGPIYPVNPRYQELSGLKCYPSLLDVPTDVDYVISSVPAQVVPELVEQSAAKKVKAIHFFTAGFSETGEEERADLEQTVIQRTREFGIRVLGPNCMGLYVPDVGLSFNASFPKEKGNIALLSQSGANASEFISAGAARGLRYSKVVSYGNAADLCEADLFDYVADDPETEIVGAYMEGVRDGRRFFEALKKLGRRKPVSILKGGRTEAGGHATQSHTASLAGPIRIFDAACRQAGAVRVESMDELLDMMVVFKHVTKLSGPRAALIVSGGGRSVLSADDVNAEGIQVPPLPAETQAELREYIPVAGTIIRNPVDATMGSMTDQSARTLRIVASAPNIDFVLYSGGWGPGMGGRPPGAPPWGPPVAAGSTEPQVQAERERPRMDPKEMAERQIENLVSVQREVGKPVILVANQPGSAQAFASHQALQEAANEAGIAVLTGMRRAALAISRLLRWQELQAE
jgi:acyl-CoA synthetase (NDP forming)